MDDLADFFKKLNEYSSFDYSKEELNFTVTEEDDGDNNNVNIQY